MLAFPLLVSSSVRLLPPVESFPFLWPKLVLNLCCAGGFGEPETGAEGSAGLGEPREDGARCEGFLASTKAARGEVFPSEPRGMEPVIGSCCEGEADRDGVLNGMKDTEGRLPVPPTPSADRRDDRDP